MPPPEGTEPLKPEEFEAGDKEARRKAPKRPEGLPLVPGEVQAPPAEKAKTPFDRFMNSLTEQRRELAALKERREAIKGADNKILEGREKDLAKERLKLLKEMLGQQIDGDPDLGVDMSELGEKIAQELGDKTGKQHYYEKVKKRVVELLAGQREGLFKTMLEGPSSDLKALETAATVSAENVRGLLSAVAVDVKKEMKEALKAGARGAMLDAFGEITEELKRRDAAAKDQKLKPAPKPAPKKGWWQRLTGS